ncbi:MAG: type II secretion system secretin GspD [Rhodobacteraceae bacterium]|nr:type II secretion system secretin GspD [Paracoccaceae bacterium]
MKTLKAAFAAGLLVLASVSAALAQVALDLRDADLKRFVEIVAETTGRNFILDPQINGSVTVLAPKKVSSEAIYEIFLNVLELNRLTIVKGVGADRIVPIGIARELASGQKITLTGGGYETRVIPVQNVPLGEVTEVIRPLLPSEAVLSTVPGAGLIILSDRAENQSRIANLVAQLDKPRSQPIETIRMRNANAAELLQVIQSLEVTPVGASLSADRRVNALIVAGPRDFRERIRGIVSQLDVPQRAMATRVVELSYANASALADVVQRTFVAQNSEQAVGKATIVAEPRSNTLLITAPQEQIHSIVLSIRALDKRPSQVLIEAVIFEMSVENFSDLSVQFGAILDDAIAGGVQFSLQGRPTLTSVISSVISGNSVDPGNGGSIGALKRNGDNGIGGFLSAVASKTSTRLLSTPSIMTLNNQKAEIVVAQNVPFVTGSFATVGDTTLPDTPFQTIERQDVGLTLEVTPQITAEGTVLMAIKQEVSNLTNSSSKAGGEITSKRTINTNVLVRDGNVIMLGGLLEDGSGSVSQKVPGLGNLPVLGALFRGKNASKNQLVLLVMLRPRVIRSDVDARRITREVARETRRASLKIQPVNDGQYPATPSGSFPFDGADLNQPFDAGFVDGVAQSRNFPPLPSRLKFK